MNNKLFRSQSLSRVNSPEQLNEYIKVAGPSVWLTLGAVVLLLLGVLIWSIFGTCDTKIDACIIADDQGVVCLVPEDDAAYIEEGMPITVGKQAGSIVSIADEPVRAGDKLDDYQLYELGLKSDDLCTAALIKTGGLPDGTYTEQITVESIHPISFVIH